MSRWKLRRLRRLPLHHPFSVPSHPHPLGPDWTQGVDGRWYPPPRREY